MTPTVSSLGPASPAGCSCPLRVRRVPGLQRRRFAATNLRLDRGLGADLAFDQNWIVYVAGGSSPASRLAYRQQAFAVGPAASARAGLTAARLRRLLARRVRMVVLEAVVERCDRGAIAGAPWKRFLPPRARRPRLLSQSARPEGGIAVTC